MLTPELHTSFWSTSRTIPTWPSKVYFTTRYSGWNMDPPLRFWSEQQRMQWKERIQSKLSFHYTA